jgi:adenosylcobinamide-phosphate synthase
MSFFAVLFALLIEQIKPLPRNNPVHESLTGWMRWTGRNFDAGQDHHAWVVWCISVLVPTVLAAGVHMAIAHFSLLLALAWDVAVLYLTLGFRQFSHHFTEIRDALDRGDEIQARQLLAQWSRVDASELPRTELLRHVIEHSLIAAHRHVFGVFFWFVLLSTFGLGPAGAVLYRLAELAHRYWAVKGRNMGAPVNERVMGLSQSLFTAIDHVPSRLTAFGFAVVGNFEEAITCWRRDAGLWSQRNDGVVLAAAAGAVGVQLGGSADPRVIVEPLRPLDGADPSEDAAPAGATTGATPVAGHLRSVVGLVWRSVVLWMLLLALLSLANLVG